MSLYNLTFIGNSTNVLQVVTGFNGESNALFFSTIYIMFGLMLIFILFQTGYSKEYSLMTVGLILSIIGVIGVAAGLLNIASPGLFFLLTAVGMIMRARQPE